MNSHNWITNHFVAVVPIRDLENDVKEQAESQQEVNTDHVKDTIKNGKKVETNNDVSMAEEPMLEQQKTEVHHVNQNRNMKGQNDFVIEDQEVEEQNEDSQNADDQKNKNKRGKDT